MLMIKKTKTTNVVLQPRLIRLKDAPRYLGTNINFFNKTVRPNIAEIRLGKQSVAFDRLDLDDWVEEHKPCNGMSRTT